ncbi:MAG: WG repeat-containing protein [Microcystaceae cyanobacterium]
MIGQILRQRYKITQELGKGGIGETFLAEDLDIPINPKPICVVKRLQPAVIEPVIERLFEQEAQVLYNLGENQPNIPRLYAYFQEGNQFYLIQEYIEGQDLSKELIIGQQQGQGYVLNLLRQMLPILAYVHQEKVIHRDIKPPNIMRRQDKSLVLIDFGVVKQVSTFRVTQRGLTSKTVSVGTMGYMPSEQAMGKPRFSSDLYALGVTAIQALTGIYPEDFEEDNEGEIVWRDLVSVSDKLKDFLSQMVRYDWRQRYRDGEEALKVFNETVLPPQKSVSVVSSPQVKVASVSALPPLAGKLVPMPFKGKWGFVSNGKVVIPFEYERAYEFGKFSEDLAEVIKNGKYGIINKRGQLIVPCEFDDFKSNPYDIKFGEGGLIKVKNDNKYGIYNLHKGQLIIPCEFDDCITYGSKLEEWGLIEVKNDNKYGIYNLHKGQLIVPCEFEGEFDLRLWNNGFISLRRNDKEALMNADGKAFSHSLSI